MIRFIQNQRVRALSVGHGPLGDQLACVQIHDPHLILSSKIDVHFLASAIDGHGFGVVAGKGDLTTALKALVWVMLIT